MIKKKLQERILNDFKYHSANQLQIQEMNTVREMLQNIALTMSEMDIAPRELASALTKLEEAMFHANAGICRFKEIE